MIGAASPPLSSLEFIFVSIEAITAAQNESLDQYSAAGGIATEVSPPL